VPGSGQPYTAGPQGSYPGRVEVIAPSRPSLDDETMILPAFLTGQTEKPPPAPTGPTRPDPMAKLPATERGMLIFVAALLGVGTIAVVTVMGMGLADPKPKPGGKGGPAASSSGTAGQTQPSGAPTVQPDPTPTVTGSLKPTAHPSAGGPAVLGSITSTILDDYCNLVLNDPRAQYRSQSSGGTTRWTCYVGHHDETIVPNTVCQWKFKDNSAYIPAADLADLPWKCYT
jgi:hypothetical protein